MNVYKRYAQEVHQQNPDYFQEQRNNIRLFKIWWNCQVESKQQAVPDDNAIRKHLVANKVMSESTSTR